MMHKIITIIGCPGSGKSTFSKRIIDHIPSVGIPADEFYKENPFFLKAVKNRRRWSLTSDMWFLVQRAKLNKKILNQRKKTNVIVDSGFPMSLTFANSRLADGYFTKEEWDLYMSVYSQLVDRDGTNHILVSLNASPEFLMERIKNRGRDFELDHYSKDYITSLIQSLETVKKIYKKDGFEIIDVDVESLNFDNVVKIIQSSL